MIEKFSHVTFVYPYCHSEIKFKNWGFGQVRNIEEHNLRFFFMSVRFLWEKKNLLTKLALLAPKKKQNTFQNHGKTMSLAKL